MMEKDSTKYSITVYDGYVTFMNAIPIAHATRLINVFNDLGYRHIVEDYNGSLTLAKEHTSYDWDELTETKYSLDRFEKENYRLINEIEKLQKSLSEITDDMEIPKVIAEKDTYKALVDTLKTKIEKLETNQEFYKEKYIKTLGRYQDLLHEISVDDQSEPKQREPIIGIEND